MAKLPRIAGAALIKVLERCDFRIVRQRGSHIVLQKRDATGVLTTVVPDHRELATGTLRAILKQTRLSPEDLLRLLTLVLGTSFLK